jgi:type II secretory pathway component PulC
MKKLLLIFFVVSLHAEESNKYQSISNRNAFELVSEAAKAPSPPPATQILKPNVFLTGITRLNGVRKIHLVLRNAGQPDKFISLTTNEKQYDVKLKKIYKNSALISNDGNEQLMSFENNGLPTIIKKSSATTKTSPSRDKKDDKKDAKKASPAPSGPNIIKVPSRNRGITDPRMQKAMERGLEYVAKIEDPKKKEEMLERIEKFQRGDYNKEIQERIKRYEEYRKSRERKKER